MKRFVLIFLAAVLLAGCACAESNLSSMSYDDLIALQKSVTAEIMTRPEWKEVKVPAGEWIIGEDIPAGYYSVTALEWFVTLEYYPNKNDTFYDYFEISANETLGKFKFTDGMKIVLSKDCIFAPPKGLGF